MRITEKYINGELFNMSIYNELIQDLKDYRGGKKSLQDILGEYSYRGIRVANIYHSDYRGYVIKVDSMFKYEFIYRLWDSDDNERDKEYYYNSFMNELEGER